MREKLLLLLKGAGLSLCLFMLWHPISQVYGFILNLLLGQFHPLYHVLKRNEQFPYLESLLLIPFIALTLVTPKIDVLKKAVMISIMITASLGIDFIAIMSSADTISNNPSVFITYRSIKMIVPFLLWVLVSYPYFFNRGEVTAAYSYACPLCRSEHLDIMCHIQEVHGEKSFSKKKVRRFISENPEITA